MGVVCLYARNHSVPKELRGEPSRRSRLLKSLQPSRSKSRDLDTSDNFTREVNQSSRANPMHRDAWHFEKLIWF